MYIQLEHQFSLVAQSCPTLCNSMDCSAPSLPVYHQLPSLLKLMPIELVMPSNHLILCRPRLLPPSIFPSIRDLVGTNKTLLLGRKAMPYLDSILKSRDITLPTKFCIVKAMVFPVVIYGCESLTIKKAEHQRIDAFELWCLRRLLRVP